MRRRRAVVFRLQLGTVERKLAADLLDLDQREPAVVEDDDRKRDAQPLGGSDLTAGHLEAAVAQDTDHRQVGARELGRDRTRQPEAHGRPAIGDVKGLGCRWRRLDYWLLCGRGTWPIFALGRSRNSLQRRNRR